MLEIPNFSHLKVAVIGDIILDEYYDCVVERISPEAPVMICKTDQSKRTLVLGGASNVALNCKKLGAQVHLYGIIGWDYYQSEIFKLCHKNDIINHIENHMDINTIRKTRYKKEHNQIIRIDYENSSLPYDYNEKYNLQYQLFENFNKNIDEYNVIILSDYNKGTLSEKLCDDIFRICSKKNIPIYVDPKSFDWDKYSDATCITPNLKEFSSKVNFYTNDEFIKNKTILIESAHEIINNYNLESILITKGKHGISYVDNESNDFHYQQDTQEIFDVSGAGDTVIAVFAMARTNEYIYQKAIILSDLAAKVVIRKSGTYAISIEELTEEINKYNNRK